MKAIKEIIKLMLQLMTAVLIVMFLNSYVFAFSGVSGQSMNNTLNHGDFLLVEKISYYNNSPEKGDIIIFLKGETNESLLDQFSTTLEDYNLKIHGEVRKNRLVKRVIGLPGDIITIKNNQVYVNGELTSIESSVEPTTTRNIGFPLTVPNDQVFVLGDNRPNSNDSRTFGCVEMKSIEGKVLLRLWPFNTLESFN
ncbi:MAG: signal peptidase I [Clostridiales bacterium]|nr:signal peptidase I [Clostridiales bacterium]